MAALKKAGTKSISFGREVDFTTPEGEAALNKLIDTLDTRGSDLPRRLRIGLTRTEVDGKIVTDLWLKGPRYNPRTYRASAMGITPGPKQLSIHLGTVGGSQSAPAEPTAPAEPAAPEPAAAEPASAAEPAAKAEAPTSRHEALMDLLVSGDLHVADLQTFNTRDAFINAAKNYVKQQTGIELQGENAEALKGEISWIMSNSAEAIAQKYGIDAAKAEALKTSTTVAVSLPIMENCELAIDPATGNIIIKTATETKVFTDPAEAQKYTMEQIMKGNFKLRLVNMLNFEPNSLPDMAMSTVGMAATGAVAGALIALMFETYATIRDPNHSFSGMKILHDAGREAYGWGLMGAKMQFAKALGVNNFVAQGYAIFLPMPRVFE